MMPFTQQLITLLPLDVDQPPARKPPGMDGILLIVSWIFWAAGAACLVAMAFGVMQFVFGERHGTFDGFKKIIFPLIGAAVLASAGTLINAVS